MIAAITIPSKDPINVGTPSIGFMLLSYPNLGNILLAINTNM